MGDHSRAASRTTRLAALTALLVPGLVVLAVGGAFAYDATTDLTGLIAAFLVAAVPLGVASRLDVLSWRRITRSPEAPAVPATTVDATGPAAGALLLLLIGALITVVEVGVGGVKHNDTETWTSTAVGYLLEVALVAQALLVALTWTIRRTRPTAAV